jgi:putative endonuclease
MTSPTQREGHTWETAAAKYLAGQGLVLIAHGYRCRAGEIDLICLDGDSLVFVEVRARRTTSHGSAAETVDPRKRRKIVTAARHYLMRHPRWYQNPIRFDVVAIDATLSSEPSLDWIKDAFAGS